MPLIKLSNINKSFPDGENRSNHVLRGIELELEQGAFIAVRGASGSGKTTLLSILGTLLRPDTGSYLLDGIELMSSDVDYAAIRNRKIGFVFQDHRLLPQYTAFENILIPTLAAGKRASGEQIEYARQLIALARLTDVADRYPDTLSGGEAGRAAVCRALIMQPRLLLADEPTGQLDSENARNMATLLSEMNKRLQTTVVMVTHSDETASVADRILTLKNGILQ